MKDKTVAQKALAGDGDLTVTMPRWFFRQCYNNMLDIAQLRAANLSMFFAIWLLLVDNDPGWKLWLNAVLMILWAISFVWWIVCYARYERGRIKR